MRTLKQNNLEEATTDLGFLETINENAGEEIVALEREVELDDGTIVTVEGITPDRMKAVLNGGADPEIITFKTPGEPDGDLDGVVRAYNLANEEEELENLEDEEAPAVVELGEDDSEDADEEDTDEDEVEE